MPRQRTTPLREKLASERNHRINDRLAARARMMGFLHNQIAPRLKSARDAIAEAPIHVDVARERIGRILDLIADEEARLNAEDAVDRESETR